MEQKENNEYYIFDTHAHYNDEKYEGILEDILKEGYKNGVRKIVNVGCDIESSNQSISLARNYNVFYAAVGLHPEMMGLEISKLENEYVKLKNILKNRTKEDKILAIGEIGLDYHYTKENKEVQREYFLKQLELANLNKLPVIIHCRDAAEDMYEILKGYKGMEGKIVFHCFQPNEKIAKLIKDNNYMVGLGGSITYNMNEKNIEIIRSMPNENIIFETDCPYLSPTSCRGKLNKSQNIKYVLDKLVNIKQEEKTSLAKQIYENSLRFFSL